MTKIVINGRFLAQPFTGVQRFSFEIISNMDKILDMDQMKLRDDFHVICAVPRNCEVKLNWKRIEVKQVGLNSGNLWEQIDLPAFAGRDLLYSPSNIGPWYYKNQIVNIHDASVFAVPFAYSYLFRMKYKFIFKQLSRRSKKNSNRLQIFPD